MGEEIIIKTDEDYKAALSRIDKIMDVEEPDSDEDYLYDKLVIAIQQYEYDYSYIAKLQAENVSLKKRVAELADKIYKFLEVFNTALNEMKNDACTVKTIREIAIAGEQLRIILKEEQPDAK